MQPVPSDADLDASRAGTTGFVPIVNLEISVPNVPDAATASTQPLQSAKKKMLSYSEYKVKKALEEKQRLEEEQKRIEAEQAAALVAQKLVDEKMRKLKKLQQEVEEKKKAAEKQAAEEAKKQRHELVEKRRQTSDAQRQAGEAAKPSVEQAEWDRAAHEAHQRAEELLAQQIHDDKEEEDKRSCGTSDAPGQVASLSPCLASVADQVCRLDLHQAVQLRSWMN